MRLRLPFLLALCTAVWGQAPAPSTAQSDLMYSVLWQKTAAERRGLSYQAYQAAETQLLEGLKDTNWTAALEQEGDFQKLPPAVILDLDETVLDNIEMYIRQVKDHKAFDLGDWNRWVKEQRAGAIPGSLDFLKLAHANGVTAFYITNRTCDSASATDPTVAVLRLWNIAVPPARLLCRANTSDKGDRRRIVAATHRILLLIGDDFNDFVSVAASDFNVPSRLKIEEANRAYWGTRWIILPNPIYGSWEKAAGADRQARWEALMHDEPEVMKLK